MKFDPEKHHRRSVRLKEYDYSQPGGYFIMSEVIIRLLYNSAGNYQLPNYALYTAY